MFFFDAVSDLRGPVWLFVRGSFCICSFFCTFCRFFNAGFPDFRLPRAAEQGGAPRLPAEEAAAAGAYAPAPANSACARASASSASLGLERMLTEMRMNVWTGRETQKERTEDEKRIGRGKAEGGGREWGGWTGSCRILWQSVRNGWRKASIQRVAYVRTDVLRNNEGGRGSGG